MPDFIKQFGEFNGTEYVLSSQRQSIITSLLSAGTFFGALLQSEFIKHVASRGSQYVSGRNADLPALTSDSLGRKYSIMFWSVMVSSVNARCVPRAASF